MSRAKQIFSVDNLIRARGTESVESLVLGEAIWDDVH